MKLLTFNTKLFADLTTFILVLRCEFTGKFEFKRQHIWLHDVLSECSIAL